MNGRLKVEVSHKNPAAGAEINVSASDAPGVTVIPLRTEWSMSMGAGAFGC